jgi:Copper transport outer membrane protein, MctB
LIDFRYHLVSIVSIFLALAVGIVLGAGPLQNEIGATLEDEVAGLRDDKTQLNDQLDAARAGTEARDAFITAANPTVLAGRLEGRRVALVVLPDVDSALVETTATTMAAAGARVTSTTSVDEDWVTADESAAAVRETVVTRVAGAVGLDVADPGTEVAPRDVLLAALLVAPADPQAPTVDPAEVERGLGSLADAGLLSVDTPDGAFEQAELVVVLSGTLVAPEGDAEATAAQWVDLTLALDARGAGSVLAAQVDPTVEEVQVMTSLRDDTDAAAEVSGVDDAGEPMGQASVALALAEQAAGGAGQYGLAPGAEEPFAPIPAPTPTAVP